jgi:hypothetical protein
VAVIRAAGTAPIERVELVQPAGVVGSRHGDGSALLYAEIPAEIADGGLLYARVIQRDGGVAWSSPVSCCR